MLRVIKPQNNYRRIDLKGETDAIDLVDGDACARLGLLFCFCRRATTNCTRVFLQTQLLLYFVLFSTFPTA